MHPLTQPKIRCNSVIPGQYLSNQFLKTYSDRHYTSFLGKTKAQFGRLFQTCALIQMKHCVAAPATLSLINATLSIQHLE